MKAEQPQECSKKKKEKTRVRNDFFREKACHGMTENHTWEECGSGVETLCTITKQYMCIYVYISPYSIFAK